jgi:hypothetical protein
MYFTQNKETPRPSIICGDLNGNFYAMVLNYNGLGQITLLYISRAVVFWIVYQWRPMKAHGEHFCIEDQL